MKLRALRLLWWLGARLHFWQFLDRHRCAGTAPAQCWIPTSKVDPTEGYYRGGILRRYCYRFAGHRGRCLAPMDVLGRRRVGGAYFDPEPTNQR